jgi:Family of unknown function (DUF6157)
VHSTNYTNAFIEISDDSKAEVGIVPPEKKVKTIARMQYELVKDNPYQYTSDDVIFMVYVRRKGIESTDLEKSRIAFFSKGQACLRCSPLGKTYGWGIHFDDQSRIAIYARESMDYSRLKADGTLRHLKAMKNAK